MFEPESETVVASEPRPKPITQRPASYVATTKRPIAIDSTDRNDVMAVIRDVFSSAGTLTRDEAIRAVAEALGYERVGARIADVLDDDIRTAVRRGILENHGTGLRLLCRTIAGYTRDHLIKMLLSDIGAAWRDRYELIRSTAYHLGFRRAGSEIRKSLKSAINGAIRRGLLEYDGERVRKRIG